VIAGPGRRDHVQIRTIVEMISRDFHCVRLRSTYGSNVFALIVRETYDFASVYYAILYCVLLSASPARRKTTPQYEYRDYVEIAENVFNDIHKDIQIQRLPN